jgi:DNA-binding GntR family transcriptional regulator
VPIPDLATKLERPLARDEVHQRLREWIVDGTLCQGEVLQDEKIAEQFGVSRTPVREALRRLEDDGLVETAKNRWTRVAAISVVASIEIYAIIQALETFALEHSFFSLNSEDLHHLKKANKMMLEATQSRDVSAAISADETFHQVWIAKLQNVELSSLIAQLKLKLRRAELAYFGREARAKRSYVEHESICNAIRKQQLPNAVSTLQKNWQGSIERLQRLAKT